MVVMAAFLNGCYGYLHTRYGVELRLAVLLSLVRSPHFCLITDRFHWWRCKASPRSQWVGGWRGAVLASVCDDDDDDAWKSLRRGRSSPIKHFVSHSVTECVSAGAARR